MYQILKESQKILPTRAASSRATRAASSEVISKGMEDQSGTHPTSDTSGN